MEQFLAFPLQQMPFVVITLIIAFTIHEFSHAFVANLFGDPTAKNEGRLTLSPISHLDPFGTLLLIIAGFGWARPVPVNPRNFKRPRLAGVLVSIAGPLSNLVLAFIGTICYYALVNAQVASNNQYLYEFLNLFIMLNILLFIFNLLPFPPLDGYRILEDLAPTNIRIKMKQYESYGILLFLIIVITPLDQYVISPIYNQGIPSVMQTFTRILSPFFF
ncbi:site-2 protease family protein [Priestia filamentosa]|uniref:site-2 protease family protein n=1 Tax=Priestia filamentosa TaxID=1402861 RepID=UPI001FB32433|nr:site-2 protease family protein [Priestia filamentosa]MED3728118.1 site-2 protease family protein [Priestia filamentosa]UOE60703.1 site-2 protease family protein [Priestia filamentosa]